MQILFFKTQVNKSFNKTTPIMLVLMSTAATLQISAGLHRSVKPSFPGPRPPPRQLKASVHPRHRQGCVPGATRAALLWRGREMLDQKGRLPQSLAGISPWAEEDV